MPSSLKYYAMDEVAAHHTASSVWVVVAGKVYDVTEFMEDHPGGGEIILQFGGQDITKVLQDVNEHLHSDLAYEMLTDYCIGLLETSSIKTTEKVEEKAEFIDISKPMLAQLWNKNFSKDFYMQEVHKARHCKYSAPIFGNFLEVFSLTYWWVIPLFWGPITAYFLMKCLEVCHFTVLFYALPLGVLIWTLVEYTLHRFLFHVDHLLPDHRVAIMIHFTMHGVHHFLPMDKNRLVLPPALGLFLGTPFWYLFEYFLPTGVSQGALAGGIIAYVSYDLCHYFLHHGKPFNAYLKEMKTYHLDHHYKDPNLGFGITSKLWDIAFGTLLK
ncbi:hypothetical protein BC833DRAFT_521659 [Globomyces pollinis-pini]|nr:hypothetical protein BC833DRAFT_521659 [Globomyces pollinis-pini]